MLVLGAAISEGNKPCTIDFKREAENCFPVVPSFFSVEKYNTHRNTVGCNTICAAVPRCSGAHCMSSCMENIGCRGILQKSLWALEAKISSTQMPESGESSGRGRSQLCRLSVISLLENECSSQAWSSVWGLVAEPDCTRRQKGFQTRPASQRE